MSDRQDVSIAAPALPKGGGAIQSIGNGWGAVGASGAASLGIPLPISPGRGFAPALSLAYRSSVGNSAFGIGWTLPISSIARRTTQGVPGYRDDDEWVGPSGDVLLPERDSQGDILRASVNRYHGLPLSETYSVLRYFPRVEGAFDRIEHWAPPEGPGFWLVHGADGSLDLFGKRASARIADPADSAGRAAEWLLEESVNPYGEHILYEYQAEDARGLAAGSPWLERDHTAQRYLSRVRYGNALAHAPLYLWDAASLPAEGGWHFELLFDYGERATGLIDTPSHMPARDWPVREDAFSSFAYGFELRALRLCRQVLMYHRFPELGPAPVLVQRLLFEYEQNAMRSQLVAAHQIGYDAQGTAQYMPPLEFDYSGFRLGQQHYTAFDAMPGLNDGQQYQLVDLYGEGLPGVLYRSDKAWLYRDPMRAAAGGDAVAYGAWRQLPSLPVADARAPLRQTLTDLTGDGRLDWVIAQPGMAGFFTLNPDKSWSRFTPFAAFPQEFFHPQGQLADLMGSGLSDLAMIGTRSVRLYTNRRTTGFAAATQVRHDGDALPLASDSRSELVAFSDVLGSGQQHLIRIRHHEIRCWPNLGRGAFGQSFCLAQLPFAADEFDPARILLADLDGSGAADLIYLQSEQALIFMNRSGNGFDAPYALAWPDGLRYDRLWQVGTADLQGLGCSSLILTVPHMTPRHWRCDFVAGEKPYLLRATNNNMGAAGTVRYRSSAQEWLDEKQALLAAGLEAVSYLPFPVHVVAAQTQTDEITGNTLTQRFQYRQGYYDGDEREFRGFGLLLQTDTEVPPDAVPGSDDHFTAPVLSKTWFHTGAPHSARRDGYDSSDAQAQPLGAPLLTRFDVISGSEQIVTDPDAATQREFARALSGSTLRVEVFGLDNDLRRAFPYSVAETRYLVRQVLPSSAQQRYSVMLPLALESIAYQYERMPGDPLCQHTINLRWDRFGTMTHGVQVSYARRKRPTDDPPFDDEYDRKWWQASHDEAQQSYYLAESLSQAIHLTDPQAWRLGLPYRSRGNALVLPAGALNPAAISYEQFSAADGPLGGDADKVLTALSVQRYQYCGEGEATFEALVDHVETAELDETALHAYDAVLSPAQLESELVAAGYHRLTAFLPEQTPAPALWSIRSGFSTYAGPEGFRKVVAYQPTRSHGLTRAGYDPYYCLPLSVTDPAGCTTQASYDYRTFLPIRILDPNQNTQEAAYDAFGRLQASSFYGTELGQPVGFHPLAGYQRPFDRPEAALNAPADAIKGAATASFYAPFSWMGQLPAETDARLGSLVEQGLAMPSGQLRASARARLAGPDADPTLDELRALLPKVVRIPVHSAVLQADRYPGDPDGQIRIGLAYSDGFGRALQTKQKVEAGDAYAVDAQGRLLLENGQPVVVAADPRWLVSERVEYNNKGLPIRVYRPYFANSHRYIDDASFREFGHHDKQYYDPLGRPTTTVTAKGYLRRQSYLVWYSMAEDENDTAAERLVDNRLP